MLKNQAENEAGRLVPDGHLFSRKALNEAGAMVLWISFNTLR